MAQSVVSLPHDKIVIGHRLRAVNRDYVALLAASMAETGQHTPVHVGPADEDGKHLLIAGAHRCAAAAAAGLPTLLAIVFTGDAVQRRMLEIDENLMRRELTELDRAVFLAERKALYEALHPTAEHGGDRRSDQVRKNAHLILPPRFTAETAEKIGLSEGHIRRILLRARIADDARDLLAGTRFADHGATLDAIAKQPPELHLQIVEALTAHDDVGSKYSVADAIAWAKGVKPAARSETEEAFARLMTAWRKANTTARKQFLGHVLGTDGPMRVLAIEILETTDDGERRVMQAIGGGRAA